MEYEPGAHDVVVTCENWPPDRYGDWEMAKAGRCVVPGYLGGSDYSGTLVERSNAGAWSEAFADGSGLWWVEVYGGHGTFAIVVNLDKVPDDKADDVSAFLSGLDDYPLADEDHHSRLEMEAQGAAWENDTRRDFSRAIMEAQGWDADTDTDPEKLFEVFREACDKSNTYWVNEQGDSMYIDLDRVVAAVTDAQAESVLTIQGQLDRANARIEELESLQDEIDALRALIEAAGVHPLAVRLATVSGVDPRIALKGGA